MKNPIDMTDNELQLELWNAKINVLGYGQRSLTVEQKELIDVLETETGVRERRICAAAEDAVTTDPSLIPDHRQDYEDWLKTTGLDDSFVGDGRTGIPGTYDLYEAAIGAFYMAKR